MKIRIFLQLVIILLLASSFLAHAVPSKKAQENLSIFSAREISIISDRKFELFNENLINKMKNEVDMDASFAVVFQFILGEYYTQNENYKLAFKYFSKCSGSEFDCDFQLASLYFEGLGVLQDDEKAINYFLKSVKSGNSTSAYNLSVIYGKKAFRSFDILNQEKMDSYYYNLMRSYAWRKVSMAMGNKTAITRGNKEESILIVFEELKNILSRANKLNSANKLAEQFCSSIPACAQ